jgi:DNA helicase-2/ATP-dependent DNA helicase PcrA
VAERDEPSLPLQDAELSRIVGEEERCLDRVKRHLAQRTDRKPATSAADYDAALVDLRDQIGSARLEDIPPLIEQMERLQSLANWRRSASEEGTVDPESPYFARLALAEGGRRREVLIGRSTYVDTDSGIRIVDWRDAPVSRLYYRYQEGDSYEEVFGEREVHGEILTRRSVTIARGELGRVVAPQGSFVRRPNGQWRRLPPGTGKLAGGQATALRPEQHHRPPRLGVDQEPLGEDKHLREITALIDPRQFELITRPDSGLVVIQGGAGSGKTTIALHRLAYLAYLDSRRFRPDRMLVLVHNEALGRYISLVLPALGVANVPIRTYASWAAGLRGALFPELPQGYADDPLPEVVRIKKHPAMLRAIDAWVRNLEASLGDQLRHLVEREEPSPGTRSLAGSWQASAGSPTVHRVHALGSATRRLSAELPANLRVAVERLCRQGLNTSSDVVGAWADLLGDRRALSNALAPTGAPAPEVARALSHIANASSQIAMALEEAREGNQKLVQGDSESVDPDHPVDAEQTGEDPEDSSNLGVDGNELEETTRLDGEDDTLLLRFYQKLLGPLARDGKARDLLIYEHLVVDEAQDLSPLEIAVALGTVSKARSVTLAGDVAQRVQLDNGFSDWRALLSDLGLEQVEIEPLRISYRATREIMAFAHGVLGPLAPAEPNLVIRDGAPVELFEFAHAGDSLVFLAEALRELMQSEPGASVAVIARYPEQADLYFRALESSEVPRARRIAAQDFPFRPGIDVTDVRQVKGLEFDYVVLVEVSDASYPESDEARHLLHVAATRAAHQLWVLTTGRPSRLLSPEWLQRQAAAQEGS